MPESMTTVDKLAILILAFHDTYPNVPLESIKQLVSAVGDITTDFALEVTREQIMKTLSRYEDN